MRRDESSPGFDWGVPRRRKPLRLALSFALALLAPFAGNADTVTVSLAGHITRVDAAIASGFTVGSAVSGWFQFESTTVDTEPDPTIGEYFDALSSLSVHFGSYDVSLGPQGGEVFTSLRSFGVQADVLGADVAGFSLARFPYELVLSNPSNVFADDAIPGQLELGSFAIRSLFLEFLDGSNGYRVETSVDTLAYTVPEPGALSLVGLGAGWIAILSRRRLALRR